MFKTPILLIAYNKPHTTVKVFEAIRKARPPRLYFAVDGPRNPEDVAKCDETRSLSWKVDWDCEVKTRFPEENHGCALGVSGAVSWFFEHEEEGIIFEDDCIPSEAFFMFCQNLLERYRKDTRISIISGSNHLLGQFTMDTDYYYSRMSHIWGWATWRRTWQDFSLRLKHFDTLQEYGSLKYFASDWFAYQQLKKVFKGYAEVKDFKRSFWAYPFFYHNFIQNRVSVISSKNLITNIGFDGTGGSRPRRPFIYADMERYEIATDNLKAPDHMIPFAPGDVFTLKQEFRLVNWRQKLIRLLIQWPMEFMIPYLIPYLKPLRDKLFRRKKP